MVFLLAVMFMLRAGACSAVAESESGQAGKATAEEREAWIQILEDVDYSTWADYAMLNCPNENFVVLMMPGNVLSIAEPMHEQCIISFMIIGLDKILLLDTCTGILNLREVVDYYAVYPVTVVNSHDHFDHIGSNAHSALPGLSRMTTTAIFHGGMTTCWASVRTAGGPTIISLLRRPEQTSTASL